VQLEPASLKTQYFDESELLQFFDSPFKVLEVKRLNRRMKINGEIKYIPSRTICLKFADQIFPKYVFLCRNRYEVFPYISKVKICFSCHRIGHLAKIARVNLNVFFAEEMCMTLPLLVQIRMIILFVLIVREII